MTKRTIALFDFDGTLTTGSSSRLLFYRQLAGFAKLSRGLALEYCYHGLSRLKLVERNSRGSYLDNFLLTGFSRQELQIQAEVFIKETLANFLRQEAMNKLYFHQNQGHLCIVISGALDIYLKPWAKQHKIDQVICTELDFDPATNKSTGRMRNLYCLGQEKIERFKKLYNDRNEYIIYAYGDSSHDQMLLNYADHAFYRTFG